jgi:hypothetical protein
MAIFFWSMVMVVRGPPFTYFGHGNWQLLHHTTAMSPFCPVVTCLQPTVRRPLRATTVVLLQPTAISPLLSTTCLYYDFHNYNHLKRTSQRIIPSYPIYSYTGFFLFFVFKFHLKIGLGLLAVRKVSLTRSVSANWLPLLTTGAISGSDRTGYYLM